MTSNELVLAVLLGLASYAIAQTIAWREGAFGVFEKLRDSLTERGGMEIYTPANGEESERRPASHLARLVSCPYCIGFWVSLFLALPLVTIYPPYSALVIGAAGWGVQVFLQSREHF